MHACLRTYLLANKSSVPSTVNSSSDTGDVTGASFEFVYRGIIGGLKKFDFVVDKTEEDLLIMLFRERFTCTAEKMQARISPCDSGSALMHLSLKGSRQTADRHGKQRRRKIDGESCKVFDQKK